MFNAIAHKWRVNGVLSGHHAKCPTRKPSEGRPPLFLSSGKDGAQLLTELPPPYRVQCGMGFNLHWKMWGMQLGHSEAAVSVLQHSLPQASCGFSDRRKPGQPVDKIPGGMFASM